MEPQQERGFWSQLTTFSKILIFLVVVGILGGSAWYIYNHGKDDNTTSTTATDTVAVSDEVSTSFSNDSIASDIKTPTEVKEKVTDVAVDAPPTLAKSAEPEKKVVSVKKQKSIVKKSTVKKTEATPTKSKKKTKNNEDVEVDI